VAAWSPYQVRCQDLAHGFWLTKGSDSVLIYEISSDLAELDFSDLKVDNWAAFFALQQGHDLLIIDQGSDSVQRLVNGYLYRHGFLSTYDLMPLINGHGLVYQWDNPYGSGFQGLKQQLEQEQGYEFTLENSEFYLTNSFTSLAHHIWFFNAVRFLGLI